MKRFLLLIAVIVAQAIPATAQSREKDLDRWVDRDLIPFVQQQLVVHPRFKGETVMFVVLRDNVPAPVSNALALSLRDRVLGAAVDTKGVSIGWLQGRSGSADLQTSDCTRDNVHYYIGIELTQNLDSSYSVNVRALDLEDRNWVTGFGRNWRGKLTAIQRQAMRQTRVDETFMGVRDVPFTVAQTDLLAAHLAHQLSCRLLQGREDEYIVAANVTPAGEDELAGATELVSNNLARREALQLTNDADEINADIRGKAHPIDGDLYQYWVTITPKIADGTLTALSASAYIELPWREKTEPPETNVAAKVASSQKPAAPKSISIPNAGKDALLDPLQIVDAINVGYSNLQSRARADAIVFFLAHQSGHGMVRLAGTECRGRTTAHITRTDDALTLPIPAAVHTNTRATETYEWQIKPDTDTYYAIAVTDAKAARRIANHIDHLPIRCGRAVRPGLDGGELRAWLEEFAMLTARSAEHIDWRALRVRNVM